MENWVSNKENTWRIAARFAVPFGVVIAVLGCGVGLLRAIDPSPQLRVVPYLWLLIAAICAFLAGMFAARSSESLSAGVRAGAIACALAATIVFFIFVYAPAYQRQLADPKAQVFSPVVNALLIGVILLLFCVVGGGLFGALVALPGAWFGRMQARAERLNTPALPEQPFVYDEPTAFPREPLDALDEGTFTAMIEGSEASSDDIIINPSWLKSLLFCLMALALAVGS